MGSEMCIRDRTKWARNEIYKQLLIGSTWATESETALIKPSVVPQLAHTAVLELKVRRQGGSARHSNLLSSYPLPASHPTEGNHERPERFGDLQGSQRHRLPIKAGSQPSTSPARAKRATSARKAARAPRVHAAASPTRPGGHAPSCTAPTNAANIAAPPSDQPITHQARIAAYGRTRRSRPC